MLPSLPTTCYSKFAVMLVVGIAVPFSGRADEPITFTKHVAPILFNKCANCHRPGEVAPFPLLTYKDASKRAGFIKEVTTNRRMPPWKPQPGHGEFRDNRSLSQEEIRTLARWADSDAKEGDPKDLPAVPTYTDGWKLGKPDLVLKMPEPITIPAGGREIYRSFVLPTDLKEDMMVSAQEFRPGNPRVVHHVNILLDTTGEAHKLATNKSGSIPPRLMSVNGKLGGWVPGTTPFFYPENVGQTIRKGSDVILSMHYHPSGKEETDQSALGLYFHKKPVPNLMVALTFGSTRQLLIPPGMKDYRSSASYTLPVDLQVISLAPHMHQLGREMKVAAKLPDGKILPMIWIKDWDFNWQGPYACRKPIALPKGTVLEMEATFDNTEGNPKNPFNPPKLVQGGPATYEEMCQCNLMVYTDRPEDRIVLMRDLAKKGRERLAAPKPMPMPEKSPP